MNIYALYVRKSDDLGKLFDPIFCFLRGLERLAEHIENIRGGGCGDHTFRIGFNGLAERLVGIFEEGFPLLENIQNDIGINPKSYDIKRSVLKKKETQKKILEFCFFICYDNQCMESRYLERSPCKYFTRRIAALLIELEAQIL